MPRIPQTFGYLLDIPVLVCTTSAAVDKCSTLGLDFNLLKLGLIPRPAMRQSGNEPLEVWE